MNISTINILLACTNDPKNFGHILKRHKRNCKCYSCGIRRKENKKKR